jgi:hypothetical protein
MAYCTKCGGPLGEGQQFCPNCGQQAGQAGAGTPLVVTPPPVAGAPYGPGGVYPPGPAYGQPYPAGQGQGYYAAPQKRSRKGLWITLTALLLAVVVACVLVFAVFYDDIFKGGGASTPQGTVTRLLDAMADQDIDALFALMDQTAMSDMLGEDYLDVAKQAMADEMFSGGSVKFSNIKMTTEETSDTTATVTITEGSVTMTDENGETTTEDVAEAGEPVTFDLVKRDGSWYVDPMALGW